jgi:xanthine/uracil/vitamin C permease (AzgA family)
VVYGLPFSGSDTYDNTGNVYNATRVVDQNGNFLLDKYAEYSPIFMPVTFAMSYGISFAVMSSVPVYIFINYWRDIVGAFNPGRKKDVHARMIERYPDTKWWWYLVMTVIVLAISMVV